MQRRELDLHFLICPQCRYDHARLLQPQAPETAEVLLQDLEHTLTTDLVTPYLRDLARAMLACRPLTGFQRLLWQFVQRDPESLGRLRLLQADEWLSRGRPGHRFTQIDTDQMVRNL